MLKLKNVNLLTLTFKVNKKNGNELSNLINSNLTF